MQSMTLEDYIRKQEEKAKGTYNSAKEGAKDAAQNVSQRAKDAADSITG